MNFTNSEVLISLSTNSKHSSSKLNLKYRPKIFRGFELGELGRDVELVIELELVLELNVGVEVEDELSCLRGRKSYTTISYWRNGIINEV